MPFVIQSGSRQYIVNDGDQIIINSLKDKEEGDKVDLDLVLAFGDDKSVKAVQGKVVKQQKGKKLRVVKYKAKSNYHRQYGPRQAETVIEILKVK